MASMYQEVLSENLNVLAGPYNIIKGETPFGKFARCINKISFKPQGFFGIPPIIFENNKWVYQGTNLPPEVIINVTVKWGCAKKKTFDITYCFDNKYHSDVRQYKKLIQLYHPLSTLSEQEDDESMLEGCIVPANPITFHIINSLMMNGEESSQPTYLLKSRTMNDQYDMGVVSEECHKSHLMKALTFLEI